VRALGRVWGSQWGRVMIWATVGSAVVLGVLLLNARTGVIERSLTYFPQSTLPMTPASVGLGYEEVWLQTADGVRIHGWFVPGDASQGDSSTDTGNNVTWLWFHGNAGNIGHRVPELARLHDALGVSVFLVSYRGYGLSEGSPGEQGLYADAEAALAYLQSRPDVDAERVVYFGRSLGSAVAVDLASKQEPLALVLEAPFPDLPWLSRQVYPWLPLWRFVHAQFDSAAKATRVTAPVLLIHGGSDEVVPVRGSELMAEAFAGPVEHWVVEGARHNDLTSVAGSEYYVRLAAFLATVLSNELSEEEARR